MTKVLSGHITEYDMGEGTVGLFNSVFLTKIFMDWNSWNRLKKSQEFGEVLNDDEKRKLEESKIIIEEGEEDERLDELRSKSDMRPSVGLMYLFLTNTCNLRCKYCVIDKECAQKKTSDFMAEETAEKALRLFFENAISDKPKILLWGGEPFNNWRVFKYAVKRARELEKKYHKKLELSTVTNGTLLTKEIITFLKENGVMCSLSLDGFKEQHDKMRVYADGNGTFDDINKNAKLLKEAGIKFGISFTIGSHNVDLLPSMVPELCKYLEIKNMGCNLLMNVDVSNPAYTDNEKAVKQLVELFKNLREMGVYEDRMMRKVRSFVYTKPHLHDCAAGGHQIAVMPNGEIGICHYAATVGKWIIGNVNDPGKDVFGNKVLQEWARRSPINMPQCKGCPGLVMCGGGCPYQAYQTKSDIWALDERFCTHCKESISWMMKELYKEVKE
jgi:uncharacterized protein